jgi:hypothetical protein
MPLTIPQAVEEVIKNVRPDARLDEQKLAAAIFQAVPAEPPVEQRAGAIAETAAWGFSRTRVDQSRATWGLYWEPLVSGTKPDGSTFHGPDVAEVDANIVVHWIVRAAGPLHPAMKARYADLAWEIGRYLQRPLDKRPECAAPQVTLPIRVVLARVAVEGYLATVRNELARDEHHAWLCLERAVELSLSTNDHDNARLAKSATFAYFEQVSKGADKFDWWRLDDIVGSRIEELAVTEAERGIVIGSLEDALARCGDVNNPAHFDPHAATSAADRLARHAGRNEEQVRRLIQRAGAATEAAAALASPLPGITLLEELLPRYQNAGLQVDLARVERQIRARANEGKGEMRGAAPAAIPADVLDQWAEEVSGRTLKEAIERIGVNCVMRDAETRKHLENIAIEAPLMTMPSQSATGSHGIVQPVASAIEDDSNGQAIHHTAQRFSVDAPLLDVALSKAREKHSFGIESILAVLHDSPYFASFREPMLRDGLVAWLEEDASKAIHILVPQIEAACRDLLAMLGTSTRRPNPHIGGSTVLGLGEILNHQRFRDAVPADYRVHLLALYSDPRGINLRNHVAHGLVQQASLNLATANWVVHTIFMLAGLRMNSAGDPLDVAGRDAMSA